MKAFEIWCIVIIFFFFSSLFYIIVKKPAYHILQVDGHEYIATGNSLIHKEDCTNKIHTIILDGMVKE